MKLAGFAVALGLALGVGGGGSAKAQEGEAAAFDPRIALGTEFMRAALDAARAFPLTVEAVETAVILAEEALILDPDNPRLWRLALSLAQLSEDDDLRDRAVARLRALDPADQVIALMRVHQALEAHQTIEARVDFYERLLEDENLEKLAPPLASRLALDLALLEHRRGETERFSRRLSQAVTLDRSNRAAAALAAGFYQVNVTDALGEAELLTHLMLANPTDLSTQVGLAALLLENGAYDAAQRLYKLAHAGFITSALVPPNDFLSDYAIAQWAAGDQLAALATTEHRQHEMDRAVREMVRRNDPEITAVELAKITAPADPTLATIAAVIQAGRGDAQAPAALAQALAAYQKRIEQRRDDTQAPADAAELARLNLEAGWVAAWLGTDAAVVESHVAAASAGEPLTAEAQARFDGWIALRKGELERALELFRPIAAGDVAARVGLALALQQRGEVKEAAREFLAVNRAEPGALIGIWAAGRLAELIGQRVPPSDEAQALEQLIASIPTLFDRYPSDASVVLAMRLVPTKLTFAPYEPIIVNIEITNKSIYPLAIDSDGPIRPQILGVVSVRGSSSRESGDTPPFVVDIGQRLRLMPRETLSVPVDLRAYACGTRINQLQLDGAIVKLTAQINFIGRVDGIVTPGLYGLEIEAPLMRVDGARVTPEWIDAATSAMSGPIAPASLPGLALLACYLAEPPAVDEPAESKARYDAATASFAEAFARLDGAAQAWLIAVTPAASLSAALLDIARKSDDRLVQFSYLLYRLGGAEDPMLNAARRGDDAAIQRVAELIEAALRQGAAGIDPAR